MKNIAVFAQSLTVDYALEVLRGITSFFEEKKDVRLFLAQTRFPKIDEGIFEYQYWSGAEILKSQQIDAFIIITGSYTAYLTSEQCIDLFKPFSSKPIVSISLDLAYSNSYYTTICCESIYNKIVKHLKDVHSCKKIAFMSANLTKSVEATERYNAFKKAVSENVLEFNPDYVLDGSFTSGSARKAIEAKFSSKNQVEFDSIVAANDLMALGCISSFSELGLNSPSDMKVIGFDDTYHARLSKPTLSTVSQQISKQGYDAASLTYSVLNGEKKERCLETELKLKFRQSCGCVDVYSKKDEYVDETGSVVLEEDEAYIEKYRRHFDEIYTIYTLFDTINTAGDMKSLYSSLKFLVEQMDMNSLAIFMYDSPFSCERNEDIKLPEKAKLIMFSDIKNGTGCFAPEISVELKNQFIADEFCKTENGNFLLSPIFSGKLQYGYIVSNVKKSDYEVYNIYLKILNNMIVNSYEFTKNYSKNQFLEDENKNLILSNTDLDLLSKTDELTGILNRRGFFELGQDTINVSLKMNRSGIVFFADMDGLKQINDTYGHEMGDRAIQVQAEVLRNSLRSTDVLGRLSGDEFAFIADGMQLEHIEDLRKKINRLSKSLSEKNNFPFEVSISIGAAVYSKKNECRLMDLLIEADKNLYIEKRQKKCSRNQSEQKTSRL